MPKKKQQTDERFNLWEFEQLLRALMSGQYSSLALTYNEHASCYQTVEQYLDGSGADEFWVSEDEKQKAIKEESLWILHWYPDTPIGFYRVCASSIYALVEALVKTEIKLQTHGEQKIIVPDTKLILPD